MNYLKYLILLLVVSSCGKDRTYEYEELTSYNKWIYESMKENYLWKDTIQDMEWKEYFSTPSAFLSKLTKRANDTWSYVTVDTIASDPYARGAYFNHVNTYGMDFEIWTDPTGQTTKQFARVLTVYPGSAADHAGIKRGDFIRALNNTQVTNGNTDRLIKGNGGTMEILHIGLNLETQEYVWTDTIQVSIEHSGMVDDAPVWVSTGHRVEDVGMVGYVMFSHLDDPAVIGSALSELEHVNGIVIDMRLANWGSIEGAKTLSDKLKSMRFGTIYCIVSGYTRGAAEWAITWLRRDMGDDRVVLVGQKTAGQFVALDSLRNDHHQMTLHYASSVVDERIRGGIDVDSAVVEKNFINMGNYGDYTEPLLYTTLGMMRNTTYRP